MESSVAELIENLNRLEDLTKDQMNELASVRQETLSVKWKLTRFGEKSKEIESALNSSRELLSSKQFDLMLLEHREKTLKYEMLPEKKKTLDAEKSSLEQLHSHIWQARRDFCEKAKEFNKRDGFLTSNCQSSEEEKDAHDQVHPEVLSKVTDKELDLLVGEISSLEKELIKMNNEVFTLNEKLAAANNEIEMLTNEPTSGTDFIRLQEARAYSQNQVDLMESRCKKVQDEISSSEKIIQSLTMERRAPEPVYHDYVNASRNNYFNSQANKNGPQTYSAKNFERANLTEGLNKTIGSERQETQEPQAQLRRKTPSKVTFASSEYVKDNKNDHTEKLLMRAETRMKEMQAARDAFLKMKGDASRTVKTGVTADWLQTRPALPKASATENHASRSSEIPKRAFVPKQQSAIACKLGATNETLTSYENKDCYDSSILRHKPSVSAQKSAQAIPKRLTRDNAMEFESTAESGTLSAENLELPKLPPSSSRPSILKPAPRMPYIS